MADKENGVTGGWTWIVKGRQGRPDRTITAKLKSEGNKLTGQISAPSKEGEMKATDIQDGVVNDNEISFKTVREINGVKYETKYSAKLSGGELSGKMEFLRNGEPVWREWHPTRM